jgi:hypothetical protein
MAPQFLGSTPFPFEGPSPFEDASLSEELSALRPFVDILIPVLDPVSFVSGELSFSFCYHIVLN